MEKKLVENVPPTIFYIPDFISKDEEELLIKHIYNAPKPKWTQLSHRRLQNWGGLPHPNGMIAEIIPKWLTLCIDRVNSLNIFPKNKTPNHVLINEYEPGQGIMKHFDGPLFYPTIATITCGSHTVINFTSNGKSDEEIKLLLERRSLILVLDEMYHDYQHSIDEITKDIVVDDIKNLKICSNSYEINEILDRSTRLSLTIRHVPKTTNFKIKLSK